METHYLYDGTIALDFELKRHRYTIGGRPILSATAITGVMDKPALVAWAANQCAAYLRENVKPGVVLDEVQIDDLAESMRKEWRRTSKSAAAIGTLVHNYAEHYAQFVMGNGPEPEWPVNERARNGAEAFRKWLDTHRVEFIHTERKVYSLAHDYCGTVDVVAVIDGCPTVADYKTSNGVWDEYRAQIAGYRMALREEFGAGFVDASLCLRFDKDTGEFHPHPLEDHDQDATAFLACLDLKRWLDGNKAKR